MENFIRRLFITVAELGKASNEHAEPRQAGVRGIAILSLGSQRDHQLPYSIVETKEFQYVLGPQVEG